MSRAKDHRNATVYTVRLDTDVRELLEKYAQNSGLGPRALARQILTEGILAVAQQQKTAS